MKAVSPSAMVTASSVSWSGWGLPSVAKSPPAVLGRIACAMGTSCEGRRIVAPYTPDVSRLTVLPAGFQPEAAVRVLCSVCTGVCPDRARREQERATAPSSGRETAARPDCQWRLFY
ncbi:hypothetical protein GCM10010233_20660 [Streptomyces pseudogriseolus]|uniref:4Fe-4S ferredoxin-type domain-containing protein n=1 Tax=Streptomyces pseudogriseolus TaxID=36817 RepID=A0ABQ2SUA2_STREZ|nr:hypothetical protein GCM10010233_20660 [Streptomyces gancidicus]GGS40364.1 hypothetical protein GCM10010285_19500 [Streptomyces rubiginosus]